MDCAIVRTDDGMTDGGIFTPGFFAAARDYVCFLDRGYPEKPLLKLTGDRHGLNRRQRHILFRGYAAGDRSRRRRERLVRTVAGAAVTLDAYNILFTVMNHLLGNPLFIAADGILRDVGEARGRIRDNSRFLRAIDLVCTWLERERPLQVSAVFDSPLSHSADHAVVMESRFRELGLAGGAQLARSADHVLKQCTGGIIATSDSVIIDATDRPVADIPRLVLESAFQTVFPDLARYGREE